MKSILLSILLVITISTTTIGQMSGVLNSSFFDIIKQNTKFNKSTCFYKYTVNDTLMYALREKGEPSQFFYLVNDTVVEYVMNFFQNNKIIIYAEELPNKVMIKELWMDTTKYHDEFTATYIDKGTAVFFYDNVPKTPVQQPNPYVAVGYKSNNVIKATVISKDTINKNEYNINNNKVAAAAAAAAADRNIINKLNNNNNNDTTILNKISNNIILNDSINNISIKNNNNIVIDNNKKIVSIKKDKENNRRKIKTKSFKSNSDTKKKRLRKRS